MNTPELKLEQIPIDRLKPHPDHPRVGPREDLVARIAADLKAEFPRDKAVLVRPRGGGYELLDGKARLDAASRVGLTEIPAWVKPLGDWDARIEMVTANARGGLSPLEIGLHALKAVPLSAGGRGNKGGLTAYAKALGLTQQYVSQLRQAAEVAAALPTGQLVGFRHHAAHLTEVRRTHRLVWPVLAPLVLVKNWSVKDTERVAARVAEQFGPDFDPAGRPWWEVFLPFDQVVTKLATDETFTPTKVRILAQEADATRALFDQFRGQGVPVDAHEKAWEEDLRAGTGRASWNPRQLVKKREELRNVLAGRVPGTGPTGAGGPAIPGAGWHFGDWREHLDKLDAESVAAVIVDPPYGIGYRAPSGRHGLIEGDASLDNARAGLTAFLGAIRPKLKPGAQLFVFCRWDSEPLFDGALTGAGFRVRSHAVWVKNTHGAGDLKGLAPKHERILHATLGDSVLYERAPGVFVYPKVGTERHPTEKPQDLTQRLIEICTVAGDLIADPFGGVATTAAAARALGRACWSCELDEKYFRAGEKRLFGE